jgi:hypothetical protein
MHMALGLRPDQPVPSSIGTSTQASLKASLPRFTYLERLQNGMPTWAKADIAQGGTTFLEKYTRPYRHEK